MFDQILWPSDDSSGEWPLHFNISHTSSLIACGIAMHAPVCSFSLWPTKVREWNTNAYVACMFFILLFYLPSQIGIDIEEKKRKTAKNILSLARRYFTPSEVDYLAEISESDAQRKAFIKLWTLKVSEALFDLLLYRTSLCHHDAWCWFTIFRTLSSNGILSSIGSTCELLNWLGILI